MEWRERVAIEKRAAYRTETYWGRPVPGWGDPAARVVLVGLAPGAHGANRTGRMFTGDRSGEWLYRALFRAGFASSASSVSRGDGLTLRDCWITAAVHCAPPANKPSVTERDTCCSTWLAPELALLSSKRVVVCLGGFAWDAVMRTLAVPRPRLGFGHGAEAVVAGAGPDADGGHADLTLLASYHVSQQNTFTGRLTEAMLDAVFERARELAAD